MGKNLYANAHPGAVTEVKDLVERVIQGDRVRKEILLERLGTVDGVAAFANLTNIQIQKNYADYPAIWSKFATKTTVQDFRTINWIDFGVDFSNWKAADKGVLRAPNALPKVAEGEKYQAFSLTTSQLGWSIEKFGGLIGFTWEHFVNDPFNTVAKIPAILTRTAVDTLDANATSALVVAAKAAPHLAAQSGVINAESALSFNALEAAIAQLKARKDSHGNPVVIDKLVLNVAPGLANTARAILSFTTVEQKLTVNGTTELKGSRAVTFGNIEVVENRYLEFFSGSATAWILSPAPGSFGGAEAPILSAFLAGEEEPEVRVSGLAGYTTNGVALPFTSGSFDSDEFDMRVRVVNGAGAVNANAILYSAGTGALIN